MAQEEPELIPFLGIEITEQAAIQNMEATVQAIRELAEIGIDAALDDFGTGYSSLSYIQRLPIRKIKLDRAFIADLPGNERDIALVRAHDRYGDRSRPAGGGRGRRNHGATGFPARRRLQRNAGLSDQQAGARR